MSTLIAITGMIRLDKIRNSDIGQSCNVTDITKFMREKRRYGNELVTADDTRLTKIARNYKLQGRSNLLRLQKWV